MSADVLDPVAETDRREAFLRELSTLARGYGFVIEGGRLIAVNHRSAAIETAGGVVVWQGHAE